MSTGKRLGLLGLLIAAAAIAFVIASSGGDDDSEQDRVATQPGPTTPAARGPGGRNPRSSGAGGKRAGSARPKPILIRVGGAKPVGGVKKIEVEKGDRVRLIVTTDVTDHV